MSIYRFMKPALPTLAMVFLAAGESGAQQATLFAVLNGGNVCSSVGAICRTGDPDGVGSATITIVSQTTLCFGLVVDNIGQPTNVQLRAGPSGVNGPNVVSFPAPPSGDPGTASGCVTVASAVLAPVIAAPQNFYVIVKNSSFSNGALRGQLF